MVSSRSSQRRTSKNVQKSSKIPSDSTATTASLSSSKKTVKKSAAVPKKAVSKQKAALAKPKKAASSALSSRKPKPVVKQAKRVSSRQISSSSSSDSNEPEFGSLDESNAAINVPAKPVSSRKAKKSNSSKAKKSNSSPSRAGKSESAASAKARKAGGRPKRQPPVPVTSVSPHSNKAERAGSLQGIRYRTVVTHSSKLIKLAQTVFEQAAAEANGQVPEAVVVEKAVYNPRATHRKRIPWTPSEVADLEEGVAKYGVGRWAAILNDPHLRFNASRTQVDLKDKWRNVKHYTPYNQISTRKFILVDDKHQPILTAAGQPHIYNNKWPRDAAAKAATKDEFYQVDPQTGKRPESIVIFLRELVDEAAQRESVEAAVRASIVHVYRGTRTLEPLPPNVARFAHYDAVWRADVEKLACEQLLTAELLKNTSFVDSEDQARERGYVQ